MSIVFLCDIGDNFLVTLSTFDKELYNSRVSANFDDTEDQQRMVRGRDT